MKMLREKAAGKCLVANIKDSEIPLLFYQAFTTFHPLFFIHVKYLSPKVLLIPHSDPFYSDSSNPLDYLRVLFFFLIRMIPFLCAFKWIDGYGLEYLMIC